jgi:hypothetical protein
LFDVLLTNGSGITLYISPSCPCSPSKTSEIQTENGANRGLQIPEYSGDFSRMLDRYPRVGEPFPNQRFEYESGVPDLKI